MSRAEDTQPAHMRKKIDEEAGTPEMFLHQALLCQTEAILYRKDRKGSYIAKALRYYQRAAEGGSASAMVLLGEMLLRLSVRRNNGGSDDFETIERLIVARCLGQLR